ncbi:MAG TPA: hypothetical protein VHQ01_00065, partial [Pyrinomonadaceae bacterium]|nr:hypothetical protein [Pyrinomonadaceae bacterium]
AAILTGCNNSNNNTPPPSTMTNTTSSVNYLGTLTKADKNMTSTIDTTSLNKAIAQFNVQEGRYPKDLKELVDKQYIPKIPDAPTGYKINYDATSGTATMVRDTPN